MAELYAFFDPNGHLMFSDEAQARMCEAADPHHKSPLAFSIHRSSWGGDGLQGHVGKSSCFVATYPPNPIATRVVTALGGPTQYIFGNLTICGTRWSMRRQAALPARAQQSAARSLDGCARCGLRRDRRSIAAGVTSAEQEPKQQPGRGSKGAR